MVRTPRLLLIPLLLMPAACASIAGLEEVPDEVDAGSTDATPLAETGPQADSTPPTDTTTDGPTTGDASPERATDSPSTGDVRTSDSPAPLDGGVDVQPPPDAPSETTVGPVSCTNSGAILCDGFETGLDSTTWPTIVNTGGTAVVDSSKPHRGAQSLHLTSLPVTTTPPGPYQAMVIHPVTLPQTFYARAFVFFSAVPPSAADAFMNAQQSQSPYPGIEVEVQNGNWAITDYAASPNYNNDQGGAASAQQWHCVEWLVQQTGGGATDVWVDGQELTGLHATGVYVPSTDTLWFGISFYQPPPQQQYDLWIDDIYVDTSPVGCAK